MRFKSSQHNPTLPSAMKTKLMFAALLASAALAQAGPPISPAKVKRPLRLSMVTSIFHRSEPSAPVQQTSVPAQKAAAPAQKATAGVPSAGGATSTAVPSTAEPIPSPVSKKVHVRTFLNHPVTAPGPK